MCRRLTPQKAQQRMALLAQSSQPLSPSAGVFPRNDPDVTGQSLAVAKPFRIAQETSVARAVIGPTPGCVISSPAVVRSPARSSTRSVVRSLLRTWRTSPATHCADERCAWSEATRRWLLARFHSKANFLAVNHSPGQSPAAHSVSGSAGGPTDDGARATLGDPAVPSKVARSKENGFRPTTLKAARHLADHASVGGVRRLESSPDDQPGSRSPALPSGAKTTSSIRSLRCLLVPDREASNKTPAHFRLRAPESGSQPLRSRCPASPTFAGEHANHIL